MNLSGVRPRSALSGDEKGWKAGGVISRRPVFLVRFALAIFLVVGIGSVYLLFIIPYPEITDARAVIRRASTRDSMLYADVLIPDKYFEVFRDQQEILFALKPAVSLKKDLIQESFLFIAKDSSKDYFRVRIDLPVAGSNGHPAPVYEAGDVLDLMVIVREERLLGKIASALIK